MIALGWTSSPDSSERSEKTSLEHVAPGARGLSRWLPSSSGGFLAFQDEILEWSTSGVAHYETLLRLSDSDISLVMISRRRVVG